MSGTEIHVLVASLVDEERAARANLLQKHSDLVDAQERHQEAKSKLAAILKLAGRERMPSARPRADKGKARK